jgi:hypothetical protein
MCKNTVVENVKRILYQFPETRNNDKLLLSYYWTLIDEVDTTSVDGFMRDYHRKATTPETITRARRVVQEKGQYKGNPSIHAKRQRRAIEIRDALRWSQVVL